MKPVKDIHNYDLRYERLKERITESDISERNRELINEFVKTCQLEGLGKPRRIKLAESLMILAKDYIKKDFDKTNKEELKNVIIKLESNDKYSVWTMTSYKSIIKKFYKWLAYGDESRFKVEYPEIVNWIRIGFRRKEQPKVQASDILTEKDIERLIKAAEHPRDKAFISILYELGARIGEIGTLRIGDITKDQYSFIIDLHGKTGHRTPRIVESVPFLTAWLNEHPSGNNPNAPLWVMVGERDKLERMEYDGFRSLVKRLTEKAKIQKRIYPHLFRHSRVTHLLGNKQINESQAKVYFGWTPSSKMLSEYSHLISQDVNNVILEIHGIKSQEEKKEPKVKQCPRCKFIIRKDFQFCPTCSSPLDMQTAIELDEQNSEVDEIGKELSKDERFQKLCLEIIHGKSLGKKVVGIYNKTINP